MKISTLIIAVAAAALAGCASAPDLRKQIDAFGASAQSAIDTATGKLKPGPSQAYRDYITAAERETRLLQQFTADARAAGEPWQYNSERVTVSSGTATTTLNLAVVFSVTLPAPTVALRDDIAAQSVRAMTLYTASRLEPSRLVISAANDADAAWMTAKAELALASAGKHLGIEQRSSDRAQIGWLSVGSNPRTL